ncbi:MAG TPA: lytic transglycosylase domain-containing protein [Longimicrobium sp.]|jgi:soluble lytic murein transglycosylase-like protein
MKNSESSRTRSRFRNDTRALLTSRPVQVLLVLGAMVEGAVILGRDRAPEPAKPVTMQQALHEAITPVKVVEHKRLEKLADLAVNEDAREDETVAEAQKLAEKYRKNGFKVSDRLAVQIHEAAVENGIKPEVAFGLVKTESGFKTSATSHVGAIGLTQLMPATANWLKPGTTRSDLRDSETNLEIGFKYLSDLIEKYDGNTKLALLAYNRGPGTVDRLLKRGRNPDNGYADMVYGRRNGHR